MEKPWIKNTDKEVERFHPVCESALTQALANLGLNDQYKVQHHRYVDSLEMDLVIANKETDKILCVIEVKRTIQDVYSIRYQYQAMSYVQLLRDSLKESPYYILTNLECSALFKFSKDRTNVYEQLVKPGIENLHKFSDVEQNTFMNDLVAQYQRFISIIKNDKGEYFLSFKNFAEEIKDNITSLYDYRQVIMSLFYEYIRGSFHQVKRDELRSVSQLSNKLKLICSEGGKVDFKEIFNPEYVKEDIKTTVGSSLLKESYSLGERYVDADAISNVLHSVVSAGHEHEGEVPTDIELGNVISQLIKSIGGQLKEGDKLMDPAAGSGNLLSSAIFIFEGIKPSQIVANEINTKLLQILSLRLGLKFPSIISKDNTPQITDFDIASMPQESFDNVRYIVLNPPFLASTAIDCSKRKEGIFERIQKLKGTNATTKKGQMPLEGPFVELVGALAKEGTIMACILPHTHFTARGEGSAAIRKMLLERFGLCVIFNYPQANLFDDVTQNTAVVIGVIGQYHDNIKYLYCNDIISDVDVSVIPSIMKENFPEKEMTNLGDGFEGMTIPRAELESTIDNGWNVFNMSKQDATYYIHSNLAYNSKLINFMECKIESYRGKIGNKGGSDLMYYRSKKPFATYVDKLIPHAGAVGIRNADFEDLNFGVGHAFLDVRDIEDQKIKKIIRFFKKNIQNYETKQRRDKKSIDKFAKILKDESRNSVPQNSILAPRAIRTNGSVYICNEQTFVSTNFFVFEMDSKEKAQIFASWMLSVFFQLECEVWSKNNAGLRKMEKLEYKNTHMPNCEVLTEEEIADITNSIKRKIDFLNLKDPQCREIDKVWAKILFGNSYQEKLDEAFTLLTILAANREA